MRLSVKKAAYADLSRAACRKSGVVLGILTNLHGTANPRLASRFVVPLWTCGSRADTKAQTHPAASCSAAPDALAPGYRVVFPSEFENLC
jgi:hypothetical protein